MTKTDTRDVEATVRQIHQLEASGCEIVRVAVPDMDAAKGISGIKERINIPLVADIHFDYRLALTAIDQGADGLRINPGNIGSKKRVEAVVKKAVDRGIPIRIGVNSGSLEKSVLKRFAGVTPEAMVASALRHIRILEEMEFREIKVSLKAPDVGRTVGAYRLMTKEVDYPLHLGITEAGTPFSGAIRSAVGLGIILSEGIGDTVRVSLTGDPVEEVKVAYEILRALEIRKRGVEMISCPTCGRCEVDLISIAHDVERGLGHIKTPLKVAVMGCSVNGPGEAREADIGIAGGSGKWLFFRKGKIVGTLHKNEVVKKIVDEAEALAGEL
jgi:(E)-4-hydroxy-3-methylbut-2-enyl-diphosphate synthase